ncbi:MAG: amidohydrolase, partial [Paracoccaceae bacterium]|nr:amidohydrolase [Paracoccaceae bacterium]
MNILPVIEASTAELTEIFKDLHAHPEIGLEEQRTSAIVAEKLRSYGVDEVHAGIGMLDDAQALGNGRHHPVLHAV